MSFHFINANSVSLPLKDKSAHCIVTSPPYAASMREYHTFSWVGGDPACDHVKKYGNQTSGLRRDSRSFDAYISTTGYYENEKAPANRVVYYKDLCKKCGAQRVDHQIGREDVIDCGAFYKPGLIKPCGHCYICRMLEVTNECKRVLRDDGVLWLNIWDSYSSEGGSEPLQTTRVRYSESDQTHDRRAIMAANNMKPKDMMGVPWRLVFAMQSTGWYLRSPVIWYKVNSLPESVKDRPARAYEFLFMFTKSRYYFYDWLAVVEPAAYDGRKKKSFDGAVKFEDQVTGESMANTLARDGGERWPLLTPDGKPGRNLRSVWPVAQNPLDSFSSWLVDRLAIDDPGILEEYAAEYESECRLVFGGDVWDIPTRPLKLKHFAAFPTTLVAPCIKSSTSEFGCCPTCGAQWERMSLSLFEAQDDVSLEKGMRNSPGAKSVDESNGWAEYPRGSLVNKSFGFRPGCACYGVEIISHPPKRPNRKIKENLDDFKLRFAAWEIDIAAWSKKWAVIEPVYLSLPVSPALVIDPFCGSGTVMEAARDLGRNSIGFDLSIKYLSSVAKERLGVNSIQRWTGDEIAQTAQSVLPITTLPLFKDLDGD